MAGDGSIEVSNARESGRVEVLRGRLEASDESSGSLEILLDSVGLSHDTRLSRTRRRRSLQGETLRYLTDMATHTIPEPVLQHLEAILNRVWPGSAAASANSPPDRFSRRSPSPF